MGGKAENKQGEGMFQPPPGSREQEREAAPHHGAGKRGKGPQEEHGYPVAKGRSAGNGEGERANGRVREAFLRVTDGP